MWTTEDLVGECYLSTRMRMADHFVLLLAVTVKGMCEEHSACHTPQVRVWIWCGIAPAFCAGALC